MATEVIYPDPPSPGAAAAAASHTLASFPIDDFLQFPPPSPAAQTPRMAPASVPAQSQQPPAADSAAATQDMSQRPPPNSSPEVLFKYFLGQELRKIGATAVRIICSPLVPHGIPFAGPNALPLSCAGQDDQTLDSVMKQHYSSFLEGLQSKAPSSIAPESLSGIRPGTALARETRPHVDAGLSSPETQSTVSPAMTGRDFSVSPSQGPSNGSFAQQDAFKTSPLDIGLGSDFASTSSHMLSDASQPSQSIDPNLVQLSGVHMPFAVSRAPLFNNAPSMDIAPASPRATADPMSEDEAADDDNKDTLAELLVSHDNDFAQASRSSPFTAFRPDRIRGNESVASSASPEVGRRGAPLPNSENGSNEFGVPSSIMDHSASDMRPSPEEYRKLSSKEKRQLRNKISARNFRTRRKGECRRCGGTTICGKTVSMSLGQRGRIAAHVCVVSRPSC